MKKTIKPIRILKKSTGSVQFRFYKPETEKTKPNPNKKNRKNRAKPEKNEPNQKNRAKPEKNEPNQKNRAKPEKNRAKPKKPSQTRKNQAKPVRTGFCSKKIKPNRRRSVWTGFAFFFKKIGLVAFFYKN